MLRRSALTALLRSLRSGKGSVESAEVNLAQRWDQHRHYRDSRYAGLPSAQSQVERRAGAPGRFPIILVSPPRLNAPDLSHVRSSCLCELNVDTGKREETLHQQSCKPRLTSSSCRGYEHFTRRGSTLKFLQSGRRGTSLAIVGAGGVLIWYSNREEVPYTHRKHCILVSGARELATGLHLFEQATLHSASNLSAASSSNTG